MRGAFIRIGRVVVQKGEISALNMGDRKAFKEIAASRLPGNDQRMPQRIQIKGGVKGMTAHRVLQTVFCANLRVPQYRGRPFVAGVLKPSARGIDNHMKIFKKIRVAVLAVSFYKVIQQIKDQTAFFDFFYPRNRHQADFEPRHKFSQIFKKFVSDQKIPEIAPRQPCVTRIRRVLITSYFLKDSMSLAAFFRLSNFAATFWRPAFLMRPANSVSPAIFIIASASRKASRWGTRTPSTPVSINSGIPVMSVDTTGISRAMASINTKGMPSISWLAAFTQGSTKTEHSRIS